MESTEVDLTLCRRITPADGGEGHFMALLVRQGDADAGASRMPETLTPDLYGQQAEELYRSCFADEPRGQFRVYGGQVRLVPADMPPVDGLPVIAAGFAVAEICKNRLEPCHAAFMAAQAADCRRGVDLSLDDPRLTAYLKGEAILVEQQEKGWTGVAVEGITTGFGKAGGGVLKNRYPKGLRLVGQ